MADNGPAFPDTMGGGYGLRSIQEKLTLLYGNDAHVKFQNEPTKQVVILARKEKVLTQRSRDYTETAEKYTSENSATST